MPPSTVESNDPLLGAAWSDDREWIARRSNHREMFLTPRSRVLLEGVARAEVAIAVIESHVVDALSVRVLVDGATESGMIDGRVFLGRVVLYSLREARRLGGGRGLVGSSWLHVRPSCS